MDVQIPVLGVIAAAASAMVIGTIWYSDGVFGKTWRKMIGLNDKDMKARMGMAMGYMVFASVVTAYVLAMIMNYARVFTGGDWVAVGLTTAFWVWLGFCLTTIVAHGIFEPRDEKIILLNAANRLVTLLAMGLILGLFMK